MLLGQDRRRYEDGNLFASHDSLEYSAHSHFRLTETNIATDETVHRERLFHALFDFRYSFQLIFRFFIGKGVFKFLLERCIRRKRKTGYDFPLGIDCHQFFRQVRNGFLWVSNVTLSTTG